MRLNKEHFWRDRLYNYAIKSAAATFKRSTSFIRERYIVPVSSNFLTQISCGIKTKCRKTRAMQRDFTIVDSLALRQCNTSMIPDTHSLKLLFLARYTSRLIRILHISTNIVLPTYFLDVPFYNILHINAIFATTYFPSFP